MIVVGGKEKCFRSFPGASFTARGPFKKAAPSTDEISSALLPDCPLLRNQQEAKTGELVPACTEPTALVRAALLNQEGRDEYFIFSVCLCTRSTGDDILFSVQRRADIVGMDGPSEQLSP